MKPRFTVNHAVALLAIAMGLAVFQVLTRYGFPPRIGWAASILAVLVIAMFWTAINLTDTEEDEE